MPASPPPCADRFRRLAAAAFLLALASVPARAAEPGLPPEEGETRGDRQFTLIEAGSQFGIAADLGALPHLACFRDLPHAWQAGVQARMAPALARTAYDYLPLMSVSLRKLWLGDEEIAPIRNSEYFGVGLGAYFAYDFQGGRGGPRPFGTLSLGKYWMPFEGRPLGIDLDLDLTTLKLPLAPSGHLSGRSEQVFITCGLNLFYAFP